MCGPVVTQLVTHPAALGGAAQHHPNLATPDRAVFSVMGGTDDRCCSSVVAVAPPFGYSTRAGARGALAGPRTQEGAAGDDVADGTLVITTRDVEVAGHRLHLNETGDPSAPAVLWLHGSGPGVTALTNWQALITRLAPRFHNLAPGRAGLRRLLTP